MRNIFVLLIYFFILTLSFGQNSTEREIDSLLNIIQDMSQGDKINTFIKIANLYQRTNLNASFEYGQLASESAILSNQPILIASSFDLLSRIHRKMGNLILARNYSEEGLEYVGKIKDRELEGKIKNNLAIVLIQSGEYEAALDNLIDVIEIYKHINAGHVLRAEINKSIIFKKLGNNKKAIENLELCLIESERLKLSKLKAGILNNIGLNYFKLNQYDKALTYLENALYLKNSLGMASSSYSTLKNMADIYVATRQYTQAQLIFQQIEDVGIKENSLDWLYDAYQGYGNIARGQQRIKDAEKWYLKGLETAEKMNNAENILEMNNRLADLYARIGQHRKALSYKEEYIKVKEEYYNEKTRKHIAELELRHQIFQKNQELENIRNEHALRRLQLIGFFIFSFLIVLFIILIYNRHQLKKDKENELSQKTKELNSQHSKLAHTQKTLQLQDKIIRQSQADLEKFAQTISQDLKAPLSTIRTYMELVENRYKEKLDQQAQNFITSANSGASKMEQILHDLLLFTKVSSETLNCSIIDPVESLNQAIVQLNAPITKHDVIIDKRELPQTYADPQALTQLFVQLIQNAIKFRRHEVPQITVRANKEGEYITFMVMDNGRGIPRHALASIFKLFEKVHYEDGQVGNGVGLAIVKKIIDKSGGEIWIDSEVGKGTTVYFTLPCASVNEETV